MFLLALCCNSAHGMFTEHFDAAKITCPGGEMDLVLTKGSPVVVREEYRNREAVLRLGRNFFPRYSCHRWVGNIYWDQWRLLRSDGANVANWFKRSGKWTLESASNHLWAKWHGDGEFTVEDFAK